MTGLTCVLSTTTIGPASGNRHGDFNRRIELTSRDVRYLDFNYTQRGLLFHKPDESLSSLVEHLKASLSQALDRLYPLAGRLVATEHDGDIKTVSFHIACNGAGVKFVHAKADSIEVADLLDVVPVEISASLFPMTGVKAHLAADSDLPLLAVQVTELADGVFGGLSQNHCAGDGTTFWDFFNVWSEISRGDEAAISRRGNFHFGFEPVGFPIHVPLHRVPRPVPCAEVVERRMLHFSKERVAKLKAKANAAEPGICVVDREISSLQALMGNLWLCITRSRALHEDDTVSYLITADMRLRLQPLLSKSYVGNAVLDVVVTCTAGELLTRGIWWAARLINREISAQTANKEAVKFFSDQAKSGPQPRPNMLITGGSHRFDLYGNDFGWGKPLVARGGPLLRPGMIIVSPGAVEGSIDLEVTFLPEIFRALVRDPEFANYGA